MAVEPKCPNCGYSLMGLPRNGRGMIRCPECGEADGRPRVMGPLLQCTLFVAPPVVLLILAFVARRFPEGPVANWGFPICALANLICHAAAMYDGARARYSRGFALIVITLAALGSTIVVFLAACCAALLV